MIRFRYLLLGEYGIKGLFYYKEYFYSYTCDKITGKVRKNKFN